MYTVIEGGVTAAAGFQTASTAAGIKYKNRKALFRKQLCGKQTRLIRADYRNRTFHISSLISFDHFAMTIARNTHFPPPVAIIPCGFPLS